MGKRMPQFTSAQEHTCISQMGIKKLVCIFKPIIPLLPNSLHSGLVKLCPRMTRSWEKGPKNYMSSLAIKTTINPKTIRIWSKWAKERLNVTSAREPTCIFQMGIKKLFGIFKPIIPLFPNSLHLRLVKLGHRMNWWSWEQGDQELHVFSCNRDHTYNSQMGIQTWFHIWKWGICLFKNHLHSGLTRINPKTIRI